jgi:hypothetical protein
MNITMQRESSQNSPINSGQTKKSALNLKKSLMIETTIKKVTVTKQSTVLLMCAQRFFPPYRKQKNTAFHLKLCKQTKKTNLISDVTDRKIHLFTHSPKEQTIDGEKRERLL